MKTNHKYLIYQVINFLIFVILFTIIKTQNLNHIIILDEIQSIQSSVGPKVDITKYSNGDIVSLSFSYYSEKGKFFGFKKNGGYLYGNDENIFSEDSFKYISGYNNIYDTQLFILREENNNNNQYLISSNNFDNNYFEIYDLDSNSKYNYNYNDIFKMIDVGFTDEGFTENKGIGSVFEILDNGNFYTIISSLFQKNGDYYLLLYKLNIQKQENIPTINIINHSSNDISVESNFNDANCYDIEDQRIYKRKLYSRTNSIS